jgi:ligand-binding SRPBCC domain-containing protein
MRAAQEAGKLSPASPPISAAPEPPRRIDRSQLVPLPLEDAFAFFADAYNLEALTPPWLRFRILTPRPIAMEKGATIEYVLTTHRLPVRWRTEIIEWRPGRRFVDKQVEGPFRLWEHTHDFEERERGTMIRDTVLYRMPYGPLGAIAHRMFIARDLERIFDYRRDAVERLLGRRQHARTCRLCPIAG